MKFVEMALHRHRTSVRFFIQPTRTPSRDGRPRVRGRLVGPVGQLVVSNFLHYSGSPGRRAFQAVGSAKCVISVSTPRWWTWQHPRSIPAAYL